MKDIFRVRRMWRAAGELKRRYDVVIIGGGSHGLAIAYYLAKTTASRTSPCSRRATSARARPGRNTTIIRSNYRTPEGVAFYSESVKLYERLSRRARLQPAVLAAGPPHARAHRARRRRRCPSAPRSTSCSASTAGSIGLDEIAELCPQLDLSDHPTWPIMGALYHPPGGIIRHDAVVWGYARGADRGGVEIHQYTEVTGIERRRRPRHAASRRTAATSSATTVISATCRAGRRSSRHGRRAAADHDAHPPGVRHRAGQAVPRRGHRLVADARLRLADRPRRVPDRRGDRAVHDLHAASARSRSSRYAAKPRARAASRSSSASSVLRAWTGLCDMSPDYSPIMGKTEVEGFHVSTRLGDVRLQGGADRRRDDGRAGGDGPDAGADRAVRAGAVPHRLARLGARGGRGLALELTEEPWASSTDG